ncbi:beta strand repeat-containing protein [Duganella radicis]|uniref:Ig-like domain-containing protein n=1 Tax=Duganella radicis TaxID=551988 RepID=A0A6L6PQI0_9BURK|nr:Ig-like domain-containing protein [Duganella radicis]MTV41114.1 hypothetical protein [Duganella radicis]
MPAPTLLSVSSSDNSTITLHFDRAVFAGDSSIVISDGYSQRYLGTTGLSSRIVGATDSRVIGSHDSQVSYSGQDVVIHLSSALKSGLNYNVTMGGRAVLDSSDSGNASVSATALFSFTASGVATPATPSAVIGAALHFTDTGVSASDYITAALEQTVSGTYTGTLSANDFIQVSLDNGASWHKATASAAGAWSYSGAIDTGNLTGGADGLLNGTLLARVSNNVGGNSGTASHSYIYYNSHPINISIGGNFTFSADTGTSSSDRITNSAAQTISGTYEGALLTGQTLQVSVDDGASWISATAASGVWQADATLVSGAHQVQARVTDAVGNTSGVAAADYQLLTGALSLSGRALTLADGSDTGVSSSDAITNNPQQVTLNVAGLHGLHAGDTIQIVDASHDSAVVGSYVIQSADLYYGDDYFSVSKFNPEARTTFDISLGTLADGAHTLAARILDMAGNTSSSASATAAITVDRKIPLLSATAPVEGATTDATSLTKLVFTFNENIAIADGTVVTISDDNNSDNTQEITLASNAASGKTLTIDLDSALVNGTHYTVRGAIVSDLAGNVGVTGDDSMLHFTTASGGSAPKLTYTDTAPASDTDAGSALHTDGVTNHHRISVTNLDPQGTWYYRLGTADSWHAGSGDGFDLDDGAYAMDQIQVKQTVSGVDSTVASIVQPLTVDTQPSTAIVTGTPNAFASGAASIDGFLSGSTDLPNEIVEITFDHGATWTKAATTYQASGQATWSLTGLSGQLTDNYGVRLSDQAGNVTAFAGQEEAAPTYYLSNNGVTYSHAGDNDSIVYGGSGADNIIVGNRAQVIGGDGDTVTSGSDAVITVGDYATVSTGGGTNVITAGAGAHINTGSGADIISISSVSGAIVGAGAGADTLRLTATTEASLTALSSSFSGIDTLSFDASDTNVLNIGSSAAVHSFTDSDTLTITALQSGSKVHLEQADWVAAGTQGDYNVYHDADGSGSITLLIGQNILVNISTS